MSKTYNNQKNNNIKLGHHYGDQCLFVCFKNPVFSFSDPAC